MGPKKGPFSTYDYFGYLASGGTLCIAYDRVFGSGVFAAERLPLHQSLVWLMIAYVVGQVVAHLAALVLEEGLIVRVLGRSEEILMGFILPSRLKRMLFPGYCQKLDDATVSRIGTSAAQAGVTGNARAIFRIARNTAKQNDATWTRLEVFLERYGFCRNMSFALLVSACMLAYPAVSSREWPERMAWLIAAGGVVMVYRYLKFYRQFTVETLTSWPDIEKTGTP